MRLPVILRRNSWGLLVTPTIVFLVTFFVLPLAIFTSRSVLEFPSNVEPGLLANFGRLLESDVSRRIMWNTLQTAAIVTILCVVVGYPFAYLVHTSSTRIGRILLALVLLPFWANSLVRTFALDVVLRDTGVLNGALMSIGLIEDPIPLIRTPLAVYLGMAQFLLPFMILPIYAVMSRIDPDHMRAAIGLGAPPAVAFRRVFIPLSAPGVAAGCVVVFVLSAGSYVIPAILGSPRDQILSQLIATLVTRRLDWGLAAAAALVLMVLALAPLFVASRFVRLRDVYGAVAEQ